MSATGLMNVWKRLGDAAPTHRKLFQKIKALVVARSVSKTVSDRDIRDGYLKQADRLEKEIYALQFKAGCKLKDTEIVARDLEYEGDYHRANIIRGRRKAIIR